MNTVIIDVDKCEGCKACVKACFVNVLRWDKSKKRPIAAYEDDCVHCNLCELNCPQDCIEVIADFAHMRWSAL